MYTYHPWHYKSELGRRTLSVLHVADGRGHGDADRLEHLPAGAAALGADRNPFAFLFDDDLLECLEILLDVGPLEALARGLNAPVQLLLCTRICLTSRHIKIIPWRNNLSLFAQSLLLSYRIR